jgi:ribonuclease HI
MLVALMDEPFELGVVRDVVRRARQRDGLRPDQPSAFTAYTDGSCLKNPDGPSGFAAVLVNQQTGQTSDLAGHFPSSTNNRAEWSGLVAAILYVPRGSRLAAYADSQYVLQVALGAWKRKANLDLWTAYDGIVREQRLDLRLEWVRGHAADPGNERADSLATLAAFNFDVDAWQRWRDRGAPVRALEGLRALTQGAWENEFLESVVRQVRLGKKLSPKQQAVVDRIAARGETRLV